MKLRMCAASISLVLLGCTSKTAVGSPTNNQLSAADKALLCPTNPAPYDPATTPEGCYFYDVDVGGDDTCCGGDLRTQSCVTGLTCLQPQAGKLGRCNPPSTAAAAVYCIVRGPGLAVLGECELGSGRSDDANCWLSTTCGNSGQRLQCDHGSCTCFHDDVLYSSYPAGADDCSAMFSTAFATAIAKCGVSATYQMGGSSGWTQP